MGVVVTSLGQLEGLEKSYDPDDCRGPLVPSLVQMGPLSFLFLSWELPPSPYARSSQSGIVC